ncbi:MAG: prenyltransferase/squalene oxidase repeat-containing protein [Thermoguttaceae bacterium]
MKQTEPPKEKDWIDRLIGCSSPWFVSITLHAAVLVLLTLFLLQITNDNSARLIVEPNYDVQLGNPEEEITPILGHSEEQVNPDELSVEPEIEPDPEQSRENLPVEATDFGDSDSSAERAEEPIAYSFENREPGNRETALADGGGDALTEEVVVRGLRWLQKNQNTNGFWSLKGPYADGIKGLENENRPAATALALLAFQGHGNTVERGENAEFLETVKKAWGWLILQQDDEGCFFREGHREQRFYTQGLCTIALCELHGMTRDRELKDKLKKSAQLAVDYCVRHQTKSGGWKYYLDRDVSDLSVTGWIVMGLKSAERSGLNVPGETWTGIGRFLDSVAVEGGSRYLYEIGQPVPTRSMTAEGLLCRLYLGWNRDDSRVKDGVKWLVQPENHVNFSTRPVNGRVNERDVYYWYYATQLLHHVRGKAWKTWNDVMKQAVCEQQVKTGLETGSWDPYLPSRDAWGSEGGRLYTTVLSICLLEVYYRHLPLYKGL